jgi:alanine racemase
MFERNPVLPVTSRPTVAEIDLDRLESNYRALAAVAAPASVMAVLKANSYGHGLVGCALRLQRAGCRYFGAAIVEEGVQLREAGITAPILVFGGFSEEQLPTYIAHDLELTASSILKLKQIEETAARMKKRARVHLKIDTGMERIGVHHYSAEQFLVEARALNWIDVVGVYSHLASADADSLSHTELQLERFLECIEFFPRNSLPMPLRHIANSAALIRMPESRLDLVRPGLALFGLYPRADLAATVKLAPVLSLKSKVVYFKVTKKGAPVSYGGTWIAPQDTRMVTIPIGYGDGYFRALSNKGEVLIRGKRYPIRGTVCMDQLMVEIGQGEAYNGDEVVLIGAQGGEEISADELAQRIGTISYEILCAINPRVPRMYKG